MWFSASPPFSDREVKIKISSLPVRHAVPYQQASFCLQPSQAINLLSWGSIHHPTSSLFLPFIFFFQPCGYLRSPFYLISQLIILTIILIFSSRVISGIYPQVPKLNLFNHPCINQRPLSFLLNPNRQ